ncbi:MAG: cell wall hydrolase [Bosea sp.]|uniref:cell wall hydrolase n=1 Tax=Bosea sp. (in: a-proteobacteria) TaxID=1871050 RepID=UPI002391D23B|nr:cell wall hydrolase [Bosea sp. (in: a-proteobacteria)]MCP4733382.1 cell wall hydrolase [Bosea sp. (in: a-proteobacteria)]
MGWQKLRWALATVAPWALSAGMLVSFTASAGQNPGPLGPPGSLIPRTAPGPLSDLADGPSLLVAASAFHMPERAYARLIQPARLSFETPERTFAIDPRQPREDMKRTASAFPQVDRSSKGDPIVSLRPTLTRNGPPGELESMVFGDTQPGLISGGFSLEALESPEEPPLGFEPFLRDEGMTDPALSDSSPTAIPKIITSPRHAELHLESVDGSTPSVPAVLGQSSSTPTAVAGMAAGISTTPMQMAPVAAEPKSRSRIAKSERGTAPDLRTVDPSEKQIYTSLIAPENMAKEQRCLAEAVYFEARSEGEQGRAAVAQVVLNRVKSGLYPNSVCGTVYQNASRYLACQFTFACEGKSLRITEPGPWRDAVRIAREVYDGTTYLAEVGASTHYHADYVRPYWARKLKKMDTIGRHVFYKLRPGQT